MYKRNVKLWTLFTVHTWNIRHTCSVETEGSYTSTTDIFITWARAHTRNMKHLLRTLHFVCPIPRLAITVYFCGSCCFTIPFSIFRFPPWKPEQHNARNWYCHWKNRNLFDTLCHFVVGIVVEASITFSPLVVVPILSIHIRFASEKYKIMCVVYFHLIELWMIRSYVMLGTIWSDDIPYSIFQMLCVENVSFLQEHEWPFRISWNCEIEISDSSLRTINDERGKTLIAKRISF